MDMIYCAVKVSLDFNLKLFIYLFIIFTTIYLFALLDV